MRRGQLRQGWSPRSPRGVPTWAGPGGSPHLATTAATGAALLAFAIGTSSADPRRWTPHRGRSSTCRGSSRGVTGRSRRGRAPMRSARSTRSGPPPPATTPRRLRHGVRPVGDDLSRRPCRLGLRHRRRPAASSSRRSSPPGSIPAAFGGVDLLTTLNGFYATATGVFGDGEAFTQTLAIQGLVAAHQTGAAGRRSIISSPPRTATAAGTSCSSRTIPTAPPTSTPATPTPRPWCSWPWTPPGCTAGIASALAWLHTQQDADGGFPYQAGSGTDPDSTALVLQALLATGQNPEAPAWAPGGHAPARRADRHPERRRRLHLPRQPRPRSLHHRPGPARAGAGSPIRRTSSSPTASRLRPRRRPRPRRCSTCRGSSRGVTGRSRRGRAPMR